MHNPFQINMKLNLYKSIFLIFVILIMNCYSAIGYTISTESDFISDNAVDIFDMMNNITEKMLEEHIQKIEDIGPHPTGSDELVLVKNYILEELNKTDFTVRLQEWTLKGRSGTNIEATLDGKGDSESIVIAFAHYDSIPVSPGADDDGSGVSSILAIAKTIDKYTFNCTVKLVLFSGEEQGHLGSSVYAQEAYENGDNIIAVINLDGIGYASNYENDRIIRAFIEDESRWILEISKQVSNEFSNLVDLNVIDYPNTIHADHQPFIDNGYDSIYFLENELNPFYHTSEDKTEHMNFSYLKKVCRLALGTLIRIADLERRIKESDLRITIKGMLLSNPAHLSISIQNTYYPKDTANLSINISLTNSITGEYIYGMHDTVTFWNIQTEVKDKWDFKIGNRRYKLEPFICRVRLVGYNDDISIYKEVQTRGIVFSSFLFVIPIIK
jgi:aminopeptidase YwaD